MLSAILRTGRWQELLTVADYEAINDAGDYALFPDEKASRFVHLLSTHIHELE